MSDWNLYTEENVLVADFDAGIEVTDETFAAVNERFEELATQSAVDTHVSVLRMDSPLSSDVFDRAREAARVGTEFGIDEWIVVSEGIKKMALRSKIGDIDGVTASTADSVDEALAAAGVEE